jgi:hypothetical protein
MMDDGRSQSFDWAIAEEAMFTHFKGDRSLSMAAGVGAITVL